ncbi:MAG TPA: hypothetical protein PKE12_01400 [Kiritimatiellia bacterium]|nr:hypothetical protein [Kiritimatiellia bacterium]
MRIHNGLGGVLLAVCLGGEAWASASAPYLDAARRFADAVLEHGRDRYGEERTPLFADGLHSESLEPVVWLGPHKAQWVLSNFANQQPLMRLLDGLTSLSGDSRYKEAAEAAAGWMLTHGAGPNGLLYWGRQVCIDLNTDQPVGFTLRHSTRAHQPYFELMWRVNPDATERLLSMIWMAHVVDWERLDYNRGGRNNNDQTIVWDHPFDEDGPIPFPATGDNLSFAGSSAFYVRSGVLLSLLGGNEKPLVWATRLVGQWQRARHPETGLSGGQLSWRAGNDRASDVLSRTYPGITEANVVASYHQSGRYHVLPLTQIQAGEVLWRKGGEYAAIGRRYIESASEDLKTYAKQCFDPESGLFLPKITDGRVIDASKMTRSRYYSREDFLPAEANGDLVWGYAMAFRFTNDTAHWEMLRALARQYDLGDLGEPDGRGAALNRDAGSLEWKWIYALLELHKATDRGDLLQLAARLGDNWIARQSPTGLFPRPAPQPKRPGASIDHAKYPVGHANYQEQPGRVWARTGDEVPLALLHLAAAIDGRRDKIPQGVYDTHGFRYPYEGQLEYYQRKRNDNTTYDWLIFYGIDGKW